MINVENIFLDYIKLRYKAKLTPGNSGDDIIDSYYFCNIKREWDKVSQYIKNNIIEAEYFRGTNIVMTKWDKLRNIFLARMHNKIETLEQYKIPQRRYNIIDGEILKKQNPHSYRTQKLLERLKQQSMGWYDSCWCVGNHLEKVLRDNVLALHDWSTFKDAIKSWASVLGLSEESFVVYQLALDLEWMFNYEDIDEYYILGPGAIRGMNMIYYKSDILKLSFEKRYEGFELVSYPSEEIDEGLIKLKVTKDEFTGEIKGVDYNKHIKDLQLFVNESQWARENNIYIHINDIEFNLCEFNKWYSKKMGWKTTLRYYRKNDKK